MSKLNLEADLDEQLTAMDERKWSPLQTRLTMAVANAKIVAFSDVAYDVGELVALALMSKADGADLLQQVAAYNQLTVEFGQHRVQRLIIDGLTLREDAAA